MNYSKYTIHEQRLEDTLLSAAQDATAMNYSKYTIPEQLLEDTLHAQS
jgi:hypothetical protein